MIRFAKQRKTPIGIDLGSHSFKVVQNSSSAVDSQITAFTNCQRINPGGSLNQAEITRLAEILRRQGFAGRSVSLSINSSNLLTETMSLPSTESDSDLHAVAHHEMARLHRCDPNSFEMSLSTSTSIDDVQNKSQVTSTAYLHKDAEVIAQLFDNVGLRVVSITSDAEILMRACLLTNPAHTEFVIVDIGWSRMQLIFVNDETIVMQRSITDSTMCSLLEQICDLIQCSMDEAWFLLENLDINSDKSQLIDELMYAKIKAIIAAHIETIAKEIQLMNDSSNAMSDNQQLDCVFLIGGGQNIPGLAQHLSTQLGTKVLPYSPVDMHKTNDTRIDARFTLASALAMQEN